jgi:hydrogenase maturation protein HypF
LCWETRTEWQDCEQEIEVLRHAWTRNINCPRTSSIGRLFDGAAALLGLVSQASYEGQAPSQIEAICTDEAEPISLPLSRRADGVWESDWGPLLPCLQDAGQSAASRASIFHSTLAELLLAQARALRDERGVSHLGLTGGVFQNRVLCERVLFGAQLEGFTVHIAERLPCNDAGLSFGQIVEASAGT